MSSKPSQTEKKAGESGLDDRSLEELKEKAIAAKGRAYCRFFFIYLSIHISIHPSIHLCIQPVYIGFSCIAFVTSNEHLIYFPFRNKTM